jgi:hypothetical protein
MKNAAAFLFRALWFSCLLVQCMDDIEKCPKTVMNIYGSCLAFHPNVLISSVPSLLRHIRRMAAKNRHHFWHWSSLKWETKTPAELFVPFLMLRACKDNIQIHWIQSKLYSLPKSMLHLMIKLHHEILQGVKIMVCYKTRVSKVAREPSAPFSLYGTMNLTNTIDAWCHDVLCMWQSCNHPYIPFLFERIAVNYTLISTRLLMTFSRSKSLNCATCMQTADYSSLAMRH